MALVDLIGQTLVFSSPSVFHGDKRDFFNSPAQYVIKVEKTDLGKKVFSCKPTGHNKGHLASERTVLSPQPEKRLGMLTCLLPQPKKMPFLSSSPGMPLG